MKKIVCFSGGKDSLAMLIYLLENKKQVDDIIYVDMDDWMWDSAKTHIKQVEKTFNIHINIINAKEERIKGFERYGFPSFINRWCTGIKRDMMRDYLRKKYPNEKIIQYIGYTADEEKRLKKSIYTYTDTEYPLVKAGINSNETLNMCKKYNFDFGGVYEHHSHYNCWMCPLQKIDELKWIYHNSPKKWNYLINLQKQTDGYYQNKKKIFEFGQKFWEKDKDRLKKERMKKREMYKKRNK